MINLNDFASFATCFGRPVVNPPIGCSVTEAEASDLDGNGIINLGDFASLFELPVTSLDGTNTAEIFSPSDYLGWHIAALQVESSTACFDVVTEEVNCHPDGETFTYTVEGVNACTGVIQMFSLSQCGSPRA